MSMSMATQAKCLLLLVMVIGCTSGARGHTTWISNGASRGFYATTSYPEGSQLSIASSLPELPSLPSTYWGRHNFYVELRVKGAVNHSSVLIPSDGSLVANDHGDGSTGVDFYLAKYGSLFEKEGPVLVTIYLN